MTKDGAPLYISATNGIGFLNGLASQSIMTSNGSLGLGISSGLAGRLHVRGDGTNPFARFEDLSGASWVQIGLSSGLPTISFSNSSYFQTDAGVTNFFAASQRIDYLTYQSAGSYALSSTMVNNFNPTSGTKGVHSYSSTFAAPAGSANYRSINIEYTINNSGAQTGTATGIFLNATETNLNGMGHNLMDLQVGNVSQFRVGRTGGATFADSVVAANFGFTGTGIYSNGNGTRLSSPAANVFLISNLAGNDFNRLQFGGTSSAFPAIARQGTTSNIVICLADTAAGASLGVGMASTTALNASAILQSDSTTKGFLPPRMTTAQRDLIASPAAGLMIYNTTTNVLNFHNGLAWAAV
jgi:hypothetical protein